MRYPRSLGLLLSLSVTLFHIGCGHDEGGVLSTFTDISDLPSANGIVKSNSSVAASSSARNSRLAVSGTPATMGEISSSETNIDNYFFGGVVAQINQAGSATDTQRREFWEGQGICRLGQTVAENVGRTIEGGMSLCYMQKVPKKPGALEVTRGEVAAADVMKPGRRDRVVKVSVGGEHHTAGNEIIYIKVFGSDSIGEDKYKAQLTFCTEDLRPRGRETIEVDKQAGTYSSEGLDSWEDGEISARGRHSLSAYLKVENGALVFDANRARSMDSAHLGNWGGFKGNLVISGDDRMAAKSYGRWKWTDSQLNTYSGSDKNYAAASFRGNDLASLLFLEGGASGINEWQNQSHEYVIGTEFRDTRFLPVISGNFFEAATSYDLSGDSFYAELSVPDLELPATECNPDVDVEAVIDMGSSAMLEVREECEGNRFRNYEMCYGPEIRQAQRVLFQ